MQVSVVVLAGSPNTGALNAVSAEPWEALIDLAGKPMVHYVMEAMSGPEIAQRVLVAPSALALQVSRPEWVCVPSGESLRASLSNGLAAVSPERPVLVATSDIPLLRADMVTRFITSCEQEQADFYYAVVEQQCAERAYPGIRRTWVRLKDGVLTGGNLFLIRPAAFQAVLSMTDQLAAMRKSPLRLALWLGVPFVVRLLLHRLSVSELEHTVGRLAGLQGRALWCPDPEVGFDVDKTWDLNLCREVLTASGGD